MTAFCRVMTDLDTPRLAAVSQAGLYLVFAPVNLLRPPA
jgi:hypothetical protein